MTKVIENIELLKKLQPYIWDTEYWLEIYNEDWEDIYQAPKDFWHLYTRQNTRKDPVKYYTQLKTLTLEEAIELLPVVIHNAEWSWEDWSRWPCSIYFSYHKEIRSCEEWIIHKIQIKEYSTGQELDLVVWKTALETFEKMLEYLIDNNLLKND